MESFFFLFYHCYVILATTYLSYNLLIIINFCPESCPPCPVPRENSTQACLPTVMESRRAFVQLLVLMTCCLVAALAQMGPSMRDDDVDIPQSLFSHAADVKRNSQEGRSRLRGQGQGRGRNV